VFTKKIIIINIIIFFFFFLLLDIILSNTSLSTNKKSCYNFEDYYYELKKNCSGLDKFKSGFQTVRVITDTYGLRIGSSTTRNKSKKIFIFGDSMTFGVGLEYYETYTGIFEKEVSEYDYYNFAMGSYSPSLHLYNLEKYLKLGIMPEKIILFLDLSDVLDESRRWTKYDENKKPKLENKFIIREENILKKNFKLTKSFMDYLNYNARYLRQSVFSKKEINTIKTSIQAGYTYRDISELSDYYTNESFFYGLNKIKDRINQISFLSKKFNFEFYLVIYPFAETLEFGQDKFNWENFSKSICENKVCRLVNAFPVFQKEKIKNTNWNSNLYFIGDEHLNRNGNRLLANIVKKEVFSK